MLKKKKKKFAAHHTKGIRVIEASFSIHDVERHKHSDKLASYFYKAINIEISMAHVSINFLLNHPVKPVVFSKLALCYFTAPTFHGM